jgi:tRNA A-37 threonylcarbamoyl transferase component Bud32
VQPLFRQAKTPRYFNWPPSIDPDNIIKAESKCLIWSEQLKNTTPAILKMYYRRGIANFIREIIFTFRAQREFRINRRLDRNGIPCSQPLFWTHGYCKAYGFYEIICTRRIANTESLRDFLATRPIGNQKIDLAPLFQSVYTMHKIGVYHGALSTKNILIDNTDGAQANYYIIDSACGWLFPGSILGNKIAWYDIFKLVRDIEKDLGRGYCESYLVQYGLLNTAIQQLYQDVKRYQSYSRKQKRIKNTLKIKIFISAASTQMSQRIL